MTLRPVEGFEGLYEVSDDGKVWSIRKERWLSSKIDRYGYEAVALTKDGKTTHTTVQRLVAKAFVPNPEHKNCVNHIDENKRNNKPDNLVWVTVRENDNHGTRNKRIALTKSVRPVEMILPDGTTRKFLGCKEASRITGINRCRISKVCKGTAQSAGGYKWRYANE